MAAPVALAVAFALAVAVAGGAVSADGTVADEVAVAVGAEASGDCACASVALAVVVTAVAVCAALEPPLGRETIKPTPATTATPSKAAPPRMNGRLRSAGVCAGACGSELAIAMGVVFLLLFRASLVFELSNGSVNLFGSFADFGMSSKLDEGAPGSACVALGRADGLCGAPIGMVPERACS